MRTPSNPQLNARSNGTSSAQYHHLFDFLQQQSFPENLIRG
jgi:hypothetical protein